MNELSWLRSQLARPGATCLNQTVVYANPVWAKGATEVGQSLGKKNPARLGATEPGKCTEEENPVWAREQWARGVMFSSRQAQPLRYHSIIPYSRHRKPALRDK
jgi:hypothetical protein